MTNGYTRSEKATLRAIPRGGHSVALHAFAKKQKRPFGGVYNKWRALNSPKKVAIKSARLNAVIAPKGAAIVPYVLETGAPLPKKKSKAGMHALRSLLFPLIRKMEVGVHSIPINKSQRSSIRSWLSKEFKRKTFVISDVEDNKVMCRIYRTI